MSEHDNPANPESAPAAAPVFLSRDEILGADDLRYQIVAVPEWKPGGVVRVRSLRSVERDQFETMITLGDEITQANIRAKLCALTIVDANGVRLFTEEDIPALGEKSASALVRVYAVAAKLNRLTEADVAELAKNSGAGAGGTSS